MSAYPKSLILVNQMAGILFKTLAKNLAPKFEKGVFLLTGHPDTIKEIDEDFTFNCNVVPLAKYDRRNNFLRFYSWCLFSFQVILKFRKLSQKGLLIVSSNPPFLPILTWLLSCFFKTKYLVALYDVYPDALEILGFIKNKGLCSSLWRYLNSKTYHNSKGIITLDQRMHNKLIIDYELNSKKILILPPFVDINFIKPIKRNKNPLLSSFDINNKFCILYSGNMGKSHDIESMVKAAKMLEKYKNIQFLFVGEGEYFDKILCEIKSNKVKNIKLFPLQKESNLPYTLASANISMVSLDVGFEDIMIPSKSISYLAAGSPIIAVCRSPSTLSDIVINSGAGLVVEPRRPDLIVKAILNFYNDKSNSKRASANARKFAISKYSVNKNLTNLTKFLKDKILDEEKIV